MSIRTVSEGSACGRIPEEIWRELFRLCADSRVGPASFNPAQPPMLLTHVCRRWRLIAHDEARLWTCLRARYPAPALGEWRLEHLAYWLQRAKNKGLSLHLEQYYKSPDNSSSPPFHQPALISHPDPERFMPHLALLCSQTLTSLVLVEIPQEELISLPEDSFPVLEKLVIPSKYWDHALIRAFSKAPALRRAALEPQIADPGFMPLPWNKLTHFIEFWETEKRTWELFERMSRSIRYLAMIFPRLGKVWDWPAADRLVVGSLECLTVNLWDYDESRGFQAEGIEFLDHFAFPKLRSLRLVLQYELNLNSLEHWGSIQGFLGRLLGYRGLEYFSLSCANIAWIDKLFEAIPDIKTLDVHLRNQNPKDLGDLFEALTIVSDGQFQQHPLPQLKKLVIDLSTRNLCRTHWYNKTKLEGSEMIPLTLRNFLSSRLALTDAEDRFKIVFYGTDAALIDSYVSQVPDDLIRAGLKIEVNLLPSDVEDHECNCSRWWIYRDPELKDWTEVLEMARAPSF